MGVSKKQLLSMMDSRELTEWMVYEQIEPFGSLHQSRNLAVLIATVRNMVSNKNQIRVEDVFPELAEERNHAILKQSENVDQASLAEKIKMAFRKLSTRGK